MRPDIIPGSLFPDYELSDHTGKHRKLSELQQQDPILLCSAVELFVPKIAANMKVCFSYIEKWKLAIVG